MLSLGQKREKMSVLGRLRSLLQGPLISGLLIVIPLGITVFVLKLLYDFTAGRLSPPIRKLLGPVQDYAAPIISIVLLFGVVYLVGMIASAVVGRRLIAIAETLIQRIPLVKSVYGASKQMVESLSFQKQGTEPRTAALIEFPYPGMKCVGFITGKIRLPDGRVFYKVFVPTTPNITVGLFQLVAPEDVHRCELPIDDAVKMVVSGGILGPDRLKLTRASQAPIEPAQPSDEDDETDQDPEEPSSTSEQTSQPET